VISKRRKQSGRPFEAEGHRVRVPSDTLSSVGNGAARVLIAALHYYPDRPGGSGRLAFDIARHLAGIGHEVWFVAYDILGGNPEYACRDGLNVLQYRVPRLRWSDPRRVTVHQRQVQRVLAQWAPGTFDVVHGHTPSQYWGAVKGVRAKRWCYSVHSPVRLELQATARGLSLFGRWEAHLAGMLGSRIELRCLQASDYITSDSAFTRGLLRQSYGAEETERIRVIPGWVDTSRFQIVHEREAVKQRLGWPTQHPVLFTLRRLVPRMGLDNLLRAARTVADRGFEFTLLIGGEGPLGNELQALADHLGLAACVRFLGRIPDAVLPQMFGAADAFVLPTAELEGFGLIILEALACGRPVLATPVGAIPEIVVPFEPAWLSSDESAGAIADLLAAFLGGALPPHDPSELREGVERRYSSSRILTQFTERLLGAGDPSN
jgi:glycosyltransferase involved in cell wall biosynthesis